MIKSISVLYSKIQRKHIFEGGLVIVLILIGTLAYQVIRLEKTICKNEDRTLARIQVLDAGITSEMKRRQYLLGARDIIMQATVTRKPPLTVEGAFQIAEANVLAAEKYGIVLAAEKYGIDPTLMLAIQRREGCFDTASLSPVGALGHNQMMEATGRLLCRILNWEYTPELIKDVYKGTELAALLIQTLQSTYIKYENKNELIVIAYNAGPKAAEVYRQKRELPEETRVYLPDVMNYYQQYQSTIGMYWVSSKSGS
jgi:hypothetical protein